MQSLQKYGHQEVLSTSMWIIFFSVDINCKFLSYQALLPGLFMKEIGTDLSKLQLYQSSDNQNKGAHYGVFIYDKII